MTTVLRLRGSASRILVCFFSFLFLISSALAAERDQFFIHTLGASGLGGVNYHYKYDPETGAVLRRAPDSFSKYEKLDGFPKIPDLGHDEIEVFTFLPAEVKIGEPNASLVLFRHGNWFTLYDLDIAKVIATNIGPVSPYPLSRFKTYFFNTSKDDPSDGAVVFFAKAIPSGRNFPSYRRETSPLMFIVDAKNGVRWMPVRPDIDPTRDLTLEKLPDLLNGHTSMFKLSMNFTETKPKVVVNPETEMPELVFEKIEHKGEGILDIENGQMTMLPGENIVMVGKVENLSREVKPNVLFSELKKSAFQNGSLTVSEVLPGDLERTGNPEDPKAYRMAKEAANVFISAENQLGARARKALGFLHGQETAVDQLVSLVMKIPSSKKHSVAMLAGPTGVGKTSSALAVGKVLAEEFNLNAQTSTFKFNFNEMPSATFAQTKLFGSTAGYVGSTEPPVLILWLLKNPNGGLAVFDEFDKAPPETATLLQTFFDEGELSVPPHLVKELIKYYSKTPVKNWPKELARATQNGMNTHVEMTLKMTNRHLIFVCTNIGAELYTGNDGNSNTPGKRLKTQAELISANNRMIPEYVKGRARARGYSDELLNRYSGIVTFKALLIGDHRQIVRDRLDDLLSDYENLRLIGVNVPDATQEFLETASYAILEGAREVNNKLSQWVSTPLLDAVTGDKPVIHPGDEITLTVKPATDKAMARIEIRKGTAGAGKVLLDAPVGKPVRTPPTEMYTNLSTNLKHDLETSILGHTDELPMIHDAVLAPFAKAMDEDAEAAREAAKSMAAGEAYESKAGQPVVIMADGPSGNGKTEIARVIAKSAHGKLVSINAADIETTADFERVFLKPLRAEVQANPEGLVVLLDEFHRAGGTDPGMRAAVQKLFMKVFDDGILPGAKSEARVVRGIVQEGSEPLPLPSATIFYLTSNLAEKLAGPRAEQLTNRELTAYIRMARNHPERYKAIYSSMYITALQSRMGEPMLLLPLAQDDLDVLRERFLKESREYLAKRNVEFELADSVHEYLRREYIPIRGARWLRSKIQNYVDHPLTAMVAMNRKFYQGNFIAVEFDPKSRELVAVTHEKDREGPVLERKKIAVIPRDKTELHPDMIKREEWMVCLHEAGHVVAQLMLYGLGNVREVNTFASTSGVTMMAADTPEYSPWMSNVDVPKKLAVLLGGHQAEKMFFKRTSNGAYNDFIVARGDAQTAITDGGTLEDAPLAIVTNPRSGELILSGDVVPEIRKRQQALLDGAGRIIRKGLTVNKEVVLAIAKAMMESPDMMLERDQIDEIAKANGLKVMTDKEVHEIMLADPSTREICEKLLGANESADTGAEN